LVTKAKPAGVTFERLRVISQSEEGGMSAPQEEEDEEELAAGDAAAGSDATNSPPPGAPPTSAAPVTSFGSDGVENLELRGRILEVKGTCTSLEDLVSFTGQLRASGLVSRLRLVRSKPSGRSTRFTVRGDLP
ncbi:MAG TPA: hypothetical protein PKO06_23240, partial [Candidatus Ozemobacteraceae bacterium]|nr:hypothetical protein [Candidatus Ozemobacteraceae bacterium]